MDFRNILLEKSQVEEKKLSIQAANIDPIIARRPATARSGNSSKSRPEERGSGPNRNDEMAI